MALQEEAAAGDGRPVAMKKSAWTKEEDAVLQVQVTKVHGAQNWAAISEALPGRNPKSCRLRWCQHLNPIVDTASAFTPQEDDKILAYYHKWAAAARVGGGGVRGRRHHVRASGCWPGLTCGEPSSEGAAAVVGFILRPCPPVVRRG